jgi:ADYC domain/Pentapeptide repeats (8 copies)
MSSAPDKGEPMDGTRWKLIGIVTLGIFGAAVASANVVANGTNLNGTNLNGTNLNGTNLNGTSLNGVSLAGVALGHVHLEGSQLIADDDQGSTLSGADLIGARLIGWLDSGAKLPLQIDDVSRGASPNDDVYYYSVSYQRGDGSWDVLCTDAGGHPVPAIALTGRWNYGRGVVGGGAHINDSSSFTFACGKGALAKCVEWGYKPWRSIEGASLAAYHQTCTRVVRADYCGDGASHTQDGQLMNLYDKLGVQTDTRRWLGEASWDENGARAYNLLNRSHLDLIYRLGCKVPLRVLFDSGWEFEHGALIIDETPLSSDL